jgi:hypothetical protein
MTDYFRFLPAIKSFFFLAYLTNKNAELTRQFAEQSVTRWQNTYCCHMTSFFLLLSNADCTVLLTTENRRRGFGDRNVSRPDYKNFLLSPHSLACRKQKMIKFQEAAGTLSLAESTTTYLHTHKELCTHCQVLSIVPPSHPHMSRGFSLTWRIH